MSNIRVESTGASRLGEGRFAFIDALRGLAALAVACHHIERFGPLSEAVWSVEPNWVGSLLEQGRLGVRMFFVISGFVIAYSVRRAWITPAYLGNFILRRSIRLEPPYWVTIFLVLIIGYLASCFAIDPPGPQPTASQIAAHFFYLQEIIGFEHLSIGFWTLCIELQFYVLFVVLLGLGQRLPTTVNFFDRLTVPGFVVPLFPLAIWSLFGASMFDEAWNAAWITRYFWVFFLGAMVCWTLDGRTSPKLFWICIVAVIARLALHFTCDVAAALITALAIYATARLGHLGDWLKGPVLQYLGRVSYSLYLIHYPVHYIVGHLGYWLTGNSSAMAVAWNVMSLVVSLGAAHLLYTYIEAPSMQLARRFRIPSTTVAEHSAAHQDPSGLQPAYATTGLALLSPPRLAN